MTERDREFSTQMIRALLERREQFAKAALTGLLADNSLAHGAGASGDMAPYENVAAHAWRMADAMLKVDQFEGDEDADVSDGAHG